MFSSEIKETIYIAIGCILAAAVLTLVAFVLDVRSDLADVNNTELASQRSMENYKKFEKYNDKVLYGEDVIEAIREYGNSDIAIYIEDLNGNTSNDKYIDKNEYKKNIDSFSVQSLMDTVEAEHTYYSYLVFDEYLKEDIISTTWDCNNLKQKHNLFDVTAIKFEHICPSSSDCGKDGKGKKLREDVNSKIEEIQNR